MSLELVARAARTPQRTAIIAPEGLFTFEELLDTSARVATAILAGRDDMAGERICYLVPPGWTHVVTQWGTWRAGAVGVPLATSHPPKELASAIDDARPEAIVAHPSLADRVREIARDRGLPLLLTPALLRPGPVGSLPDVDERRPALMLYTSGTTGRPKGVVLSHANLRAQVESLTEAWEWTKEDHILLHLPLHHVHGIVNVLMTSLWNGATCEILPRFLPVDVWERLARVEATLYMAVPTVYRRLIETWETADAQTRAAWTAGARACRLMVSGSAALPVPTLEQWQRVAQHRLLERYGMTEIGMALSNPFHGTRRAGFVGTPLPGVDARLVDDEEKPVEDGEPGQIQVRGATVFEHYWERPDETAEAFTDDGWFRTGDLAVIEDGGWRILGRSSVDILKTGGEKISALEIEDVLRAHPAVSDCAVVGVPDALWGRPGVRRRRATTLLAGIDERAPGLRQERLAPYKVPKDVLILDALPRNAMGKVTKPEVRSLFGPDEQP